MTDYSSSCDVNLSSRSKIFDFGSMRVADGRIQFLTSDNTYLITLFGADPRWKARVVCYSGSITRLMRNNGRRSLIIWVVGQRTPRSSAITSPKDAKLSSN